jgi:uncharacterized protein
MPRQVPEISMSNSHPLRITVVNLPAEGLRCEGAATAAALGIPEDDRIRFAAPLRFSLRVSPVQTKVLVEGRLEVRLRCGCDRCLAPFEIQTQTDDVCHLLELPDDGVLDLTEEVREDMLLVLPNRCLCRKDCLGLCPHCGADLNMGACSCAGERLGDDVWSALDQAQPAARARRQ